MQIKIYNVTQLLIQKPIESWDLKLNKWQCKTAVTVTFWQLFCFACTKIILLCVDAKIQLCFRRKMLYMLLISRARNTMVAAQTCGPVALFSTPSWSARSRLTTITYDSYLKRYWKPRSLLFFNNEAQWFKNFGLLTRPGEKFFLL